MFKSSQQQARIRRTEVEGIRGEREREKQGRQASKFGRGRWRGVCWGEGGGREATTDRGEGKARQRALTKERKPSEEGKRMRSSQPSRSQIWQQQPSLRQIHQMPCVLVACNQLQVCNPAASTKEGLQRQQLLLLLVIVFFFCLCLCQ